MTSSREENATFEMNARRMDLELPDGKRSVPAETIFVPHQRGMKIPPPPETNYRAVHRIRLSALQHNYNYVESAANRQRCSVITVVKADGYGHGAIATALHLADRCGADAFAVATLEEAIALRRAFENNPPGRWSKQLAAAYHTQMSHANDGATAVQTTSGTNTVVTALSSGSSSPSCSEAAARSLRPARIRILVLGPPVGFPRCFDDYYYHDIEVSVSGQEVAAALMEWVMNEKERKRTQVERAAMEAKARALLAPLGQRQIFVEDNKHKGPHFNKATSMPGTDEEMEEVESSRKPLIHPSSTLGNVSGMDLAKEVRAILMSQKAATEAATFERQKATAKRSSVATVSEIYSSESSVASENRPMQVIAAPDLPKGTVQVFGGIEAAAKNSRIRALAEEKAFEVFQEDSASEVSIQHASHTEKTRPAVRKRLRWHALVDTGMGRLGFKPELVRDDGSGKRDAVDVIQELVDAEILANSPIEFYGMCTHMADANSTSNYTNAQIQKFIYMLKRVRAAGISIPTISTDNSAALLTTTLNHFDPKQILCQPGTDSRGFVRTGGAIFGQRPAFRQLKAVSTLLASVRHVAILKKGESVGYDRAYIAPYDVRIATLTIGFADGYPRELGNGVGKVAIRGAVFPVAGNVCMDMLMVDLGPAEDTSGVGASVAVRDTAVLWGPLEDDDDEGLVRLQDIAATLKTTLSALTCGLDKIRVLRQFV